MDPKPFIQFSIASRVLSCFHGTNYLLIKDGKKNSKITIPGESVEVQAAALGPNLVWLSLTGDTITPCAWYNPVKNTWGELGLSELSDKYGCLRALPHVLAPSGGLPVWWILTGYESPESCLVVSLKSLDTHFESKLVRGNLVSASLERDSLKLVTTQGEFRL